MFQNLKAEMVRHNLSVADVGRAIGKTERTTRDKISGRYPFTLDEVWTILNEIFPGMAFDYLFAQSGDHAS